MTAVDYPALSRRADQLRQDLGLGRGPLPDILDVLRKAELVVVLRSLGPGGPDGMYVRHGGRGYVLLNSSRYFPRLRFTAAHELAHHVLEHVVSVDESVFEDGGDPREKAANSFAAAFLVPKSALAERLVGATLDSAMVLNLATEFGVSYDTLVYRLHNCSLLPGGAIQRDELKAQRVPVVSSSLEMPQPPESALPPEYGRRAVAAFMQERITQDRLAELIGQAPSDLADLFEAGGETVRDDETG